MQAFNNPQYLQLNKGGSKARLSILKMKALDHNRNCPPSMAQNWKQARSNGFHNVLKNICDLSQGLTGKTPVWYCHTGQQFRHEVKANEYVNKYSNGYYTNADGETSKDGSGLCYGIISMLPHGKFIAGYFVGDNNERVYFDQMFDCEYDAASMADEHARVQAEAMQEYSQRFNDYQELTDKIDGYVERLKECLALRNKPDFEYTRRTAKHLILRINCEREEIKQSYADFL